MAGSSLADYADIVMGQSPPGEACSSNGPGLPLLNGPTEYGPHHPTPAQYTTDARKRARPGDVLFCVRGSTTGRMNWADREYAIGRGVAAIRHKDRADLQPFVRAVIEYGLPGLLAQATGSTFPNVSATQLASLWWPPLEEAEQRAIAHILGTLDDKIELNRRMSETLEAMARALFKSWFVDFDPVRAKAEGRDPGLPQPLADLFPARLVDSELGEIPEGWEVKPLSDCVDVTRGLSYKGSGLSDAGVPMHNLNSIYEGGGYKHDGIKRYDGDYKSHHVAQPGDLIVANTEQGHDRLLIGYAAIVPGRFGPENLFSHHIYRVRLNKASKLTSDHLCHLLNTRVMHDIVSGYANGTTVNMLPIDGLQSPLIVVPPERAIATFSSIAKAARMRREEIVEESRTLAALRDALLPKLVSGELRVEDAERFIGRTI
ncbi:restriction endonuclease subunit S [bacterium]|nr:restriction endonuclease subunit S [bacterium]